MSERNIDRLKIKQSAVPGKIPTGTTGTDLSKIHQGEFALNTADYRLFSYDGTKVFEIGAKTFLGLSGGTITGDLYVTQTLSALTYFQETEEVRPTVVSATPPTLTGNTWLRTTDRELFVFDEARAKWLGIKEERVSGSRGSSNVTDQFLRHYDGTSYNLSPYLVPYDATIVGMTTVGNVAQTWSAIVNSGTTTGGTINMFVGVGEIVDVAVTSTTTNDTTLNVDVDSGLILGLSLSGTSIDYPKIDLFLKRRGN